MDQMPSWMPNYARRERDKKYRREWMRDKRARLRKEQGISATREQELLTKGKCGICEMLLKSAYHYDCPGAEKYKDYV